MRHRPKLILSIIGAAALLALAPRVRAQNAPAAAINASTTIAVTNTFQTVFSRNPSRQGCSIQNTGTNSMYVYFDVAANATIAKSVKLSAGNSVTCNIGNTTLLNAVVITGTATETFYAAEW
jgi:ABC-type amino acid transport substrate-binding protein